MYPMNRSVALVIAGSEAPAGQFRSVNEVDESFRLTD
jgi:hypothetical protein